MKILHAIFLGLFISIKLLMPAQDFKVQIKSTDDYSGYIKPLKAGGTHQFQISVTNNLRDTCNVSINIASMGIVSSWVSSDPTSITVFPAQTVNFLITLNVPAGAFEGIYTMPLYFNAYDKKNTNHSFDYIAQTIIVDNSVPITPTFSISQTSTSITAYNWSAWDAQSVIYTNLNSTSGYNGIKTYTVILKNPDNTVKENKSFDAINTSSYKFSGLVANTNYKVNLLATDVAGNSNTSEKSAITAPAPPVLSVSVATYCSITLTWNAIAGASTYNLYNSTGSPVLITNTDGTSYTISGLQPGTTYKFYANARTNAGLVSDQGNTLTVTTLPIPSPAFSAYMPDMCTSDKVIQITEVPYSDTYTWTVSNPLSINGSSTFETTSNSISIHSNSTSGTGSISVVANLTCGFPSNITTQPIVIGTPTPSITSKKISASGEPTEYQFTATALQNVTYNWYVNNVLRENYSYPNNQFEWYFPAGVSRTIKCNINNTCGTSIFSNSITRTGEIKEPKYLIYPNPVSTELTISLAENTTSDNSSGQEKIKTIKSIKILDNYGTTHIQKNFGNETRSTKINISDLQTGSYLIIVNEGYETESYTFLKN